MNKLAEMMDALGWDRATGQKRVIKQGKLNGTKQPETQSKEVKLLNGVTKADWRNKW